MLFLWEGVNIQGKLTFEHAKTHGNFWMLLCYFPVDVYISKDDNNNYNIQTKLNIQKTKIGRAVWDVSM